MVAALVVVSVALGLVAGLCGWMAYLMVKENERHSLDLIERAAEAEKSRDYTLEQAAARAGMAIKVPTREELRAYVNKPDGTTEYMDGTAKDRTGQYTEDQKNIVKILGPRAADVDDLPEPRGRSAY